MDWKDEVKAKQQEEQRKRDAEKARKEAKEQEHRRRKIEALGRKFSCHICGKKPTGPKIDRYLDHSGYSYIDSGTKMEESIDWNKPDNLEKCKKCKRWTCSDHLHEEKCKYCWGHYS